MARCLTVFMFGRHSLPPQPVSTPLFSPTVRSRIERVTVIAVNIETPTPIRSVKAKPRTGPLPKLYSSSDVTAVHRLLSKIAVKARLKELMGVGVKKG